MSERTGILWTLSNTKKGKKEKEKKAGYASEILQASSVVSLMEVEGVAIRTQTTAPNRPLIRSSGCVIIRFCPASAVTEPVLTCKWLASNWQRKRLVKEAVCLLLLRHGTPPGGKVLIFAI